MNPLQRILVVEDDPDIRMLIAFSLETLGGLQVCPCAGGQEALTRCAAFAPDLALLDVMMPDMDGPSTLRALRRLEGFGQLPALFLTAKSMPHEIESLLSDGALGVIVKPFDPERLAENIRLYWQQTQAALPDPTP